MVTAGRAGSSTLFMGELGPHPFSSVQAFSWALAVYSEPACAEPVGGRSGRGSAGQDRFPVVWTGLKNGRHSSASKQEPESFQYQGEQEGGIWKLRDNPVGDRRDHIKDLQ